MVQVANGFALSRMRGYGVGFDIWTLNFSYTSSTWDSKFKIQNDSQASPNFLNSIPNAKKKNVVINVQIICT